MNNPNSTIISELNDRSREVFREIVEAYVAEGGPVGSRTISRRLKMPLSPATIRNVMADLEDMGLLYAPHTSAGRLPTDAGLRLFVDGLLEIGDLSSEDRENIEARCLSHGTNLNEALGEATSLLSGLAQCAGLVVAPKTARPLKHIEFVNLGDGQVLAVLVTDDGFVENRIIDMPTGTPPSALVQAGNYLNARLAGKTIDGARHAVGQEIELRRAEIDQITANLIDAGLAAWSGTGATGNNAGSGGTLIVKGQSRLLDEVSAVQDLERVRAIAMLPNGVDARAAAARLRFVSIYLSIYLYTYIYIYICVAFSASLCCRSGGVFVRVFRISVFLIGAVRVHTYWCGTCVC